MLNPPPEKKILSVLVKISRKKELIFSRSVLFHMKTRVSNILGMIVSAQDPLKFDIFFLFLFIYFFFFDDFRNSKSFGTVLT